MYRRGHAEPEMKTVEVAMSGLYGFQITFLVGKKSFWKSAYENLYELLAIFPENIEKVKPRMRL